MRILLSLVIALSSAGCISVFGSRQLPKDKVLLEIDLEQEKQLFASLGFTNIVTHGAGRRDSTGDRLWFAVRTGDTGNKDTWKEYLVVVTAQGAHVKPWRIANEEMTDYEEIAYWADSDGAYYVKSGERLPKDCWPISYSADWLALRAPGRRPWLARLDTPMTVITEFPDSHIYTDIFADGQMVHVFARRGWQNSEGPMMYQYYDFSQEEVPQPVRQEIIPWARSVWDMDPDTGLALISDKNSFWGRLWLLDVNTGKRKWISVAWPVCIVKKEVAEKWQELTKP